MRAAYCKAMALTALRLATQDAPAFNKDDLLVCERVVKMTGPGGADAAKIVEVWTKRPFEPGSLLLAPVSSTIMDRLWTAKRSASIEVPGAGPFAYPTRRTVALDGHVNGVLDEKGSGNLFWSLERTPDRRKANLVLQPMRLTLTNFLTLPMSRKRKSTWWSDELALPKFLENPKTIEARTKLVALEDKVVRYAAEADKKAKAALADKKAKEDK